MATPTVLAPYTVQQFFTTNGTPLSGGLLYTYEAGTTTPITTYTNSGGVSTNTNPIVLNAQGQASIWLLPNVYYKFALTDSNGNNIPGWPVDNISVAQLLTLFGGVDTGAASAYIVNFTASFTSLTNGIVLYWIPANSNTGASTFNVNGLGVLPILNITGSALGANQIIAGQITETVYYSGNWYLLTVSNFTGPLIGTFGTSTTIASAATTDLGSASAHVVNVTGTTSITSFGTSASTIAPIYIVTFASSLIIEYNSGAILPAIFFSEPSQYLYVNAGDSLLAKYLGSGIWQIVGYFYANANADSYLTTAFSTTVTSFAATGLSVTLGVGYYSIRVFVYGYSTGGTSDGIALQFGGTSTWTQVSSVAGNAPFIGSGSLSVTQGSPGTSASPTTFASVANLGIALCDSIVSEGIINVTAAGTLTVTAGQTSGPANTSYLGIGSYMITKRL